MQWTSERGHPPRSRSRIRSGAASIQPAWLPARVSQQKGAQKRVHQNKENASRASSSPRARSRAASQGEVPNRRARGRATDLVIALAQASTTAGARGERFLIVLTTRSSIDSSKASRGSPRIRPWCNFTAKRPHCNQRPRRTSTASRPCWEPQAATSSTATPATSTHTRRTRPAS